MTNDTNKRLYELAPTFMLGIGLAVWLCIGLLCLP